MNPYEIAFFSGGLAIILFIFLFGKRLGNSKFHLNLSKIGVELHADKNVLLLLLALIMIGSGIYLRVHDFENRISSLNNKITSKETEIVKVNEKLDDIRSDLQSLKLYDLPAALVFPDTVNPNSFRYTIFKQGVNDEAYAQLNATVNDDDAGIKTVKLKDLKSSDKIKIVASSGDDSKSWIGVIEIPKTKIIMNPFRNTN